MFCSFRVHILWLLGEIYSKVFYFYTIISRIFFCWDYWHVPLSPATAYNFFLKKSTHTFITALLQWARAVSKGLRTGNRLSVMLAISSCAAGSLVRNQRYYLVINTISKIQYVVMTRYRLWTGLYFTNNKIVLVFMFVCLFVYPFLVTLLWKTTPPVHSPRGFSSPLLGTATHMLNNILFR